MALIGLNSFRYSVLTEASDGTPSYAGAQTPGKAVSCTFSPNNSEGKLYADDTLAEYASLFAGGTVTMGIDDEDLETMATLLGHTITSGGQMTRKDNDVAPYVGLGRIVTKMVGGTYVYKVEFLYKVKFKEPEQSNNTKGESVEFATTSIEGNVAALANHKWSESQEFTSQADALSFLEGLLAGNESE